MTPLDVLWWALAIAGSVIALTLAILILIGAVRSLRKPTASRTTRIMKGDRR